MRLILDRFSIFSCCRFVAPVFAWGMVLAILAGCSTKGDFGRPRQLKMLEFTSDFITDTFIDDDISQLQASSGNYKGVQFALTKPEIFLRDSAVHFNQSLTSRHRGPGRKLEPTAYAENMTEKELTYGPSRIGILHAQIKSDLGWLDRFASAARRVKIADGERALYLATKKFGITNQDRVRTYSRIKENEQIIFGVFGDIDERIASYVYVLERTPIETPGVSTGKAQAALEMLRSAAASARVRYDKIARRLARHHAYIPGSWRPILTRSIPKKRKRKISRKKKVRRKKAMRRKRRLTQPKITKSIARKNSLSTYKVDMRKAEEDQARNGYVVNQNGLLQQGAPLNLSPPKK